MDKLTLSNPKEIEIFIDPFRTRIMHLIKDNHKPMTVKEIADEMGEVPAKVYYHVKKLESINVLYLKYTKQINGIIAKYYDLKYQSFALRVEDKEKGSGEMALRFIRQYSSCFDDAKQKFLDLYNKSENKDSQEEAIDDGDVYIDVKDKYSINPNDVEKFNNELSELFEKYRYEGDGAVKYSIFCSMIKIRGKKNSRG